MAEEEWRAVPGYEKTYEVSSLGRVRSVPRQGTHGGLLSLNVGKRGYPRVALVQNCQQRTLVVHKLVTSAFLGPRATGLEVRHLDGDRLNCALTNLAYGTPVENANDQRLHGTNACLRKTHCKYGHPFDAINTRVTNAGRRQCRTCEGWTGYAAAVREAA